MSKKGYLSVGDAHQLYFETFGNENGLPILFLHGGPGFFCSEYDLQFFNLEKHYVILFDQRGCGKSLPKGSLKKNTTDHLVQDVQLLLDFLQVEKPLLFGGSWGSTLALIIAIRQPELASGLILRGPFLATLESRAYMERGGSKLDFPKYWNRLSSLVPEERQEELIEYYQEQILFGDLPSKQTYAYEWERYGLCLSRSEISEVEVKERMQGFDGVERAQIFMHFTKHHFFIPDNYILDNVNKIGAIPVEIVQGIQDHICPSKFAEKLQQAIPQAELHLVDGGHSPYEETLAIKLKAILENWTP